MWFLRQPTKDYFLIIWLFYLTVTVDISWSFSISLTYDILFVIEFCLVFSMQQIGNAKLFLLIFRMCKTLPDFNYSSSCLFFEPFHDWMNFNPHCDVWTDLLFVFYGLKCKFLRASACSGHLANYCRSHFTD